MDGGIICWRNKTILPARPPPYQYRREKTHDTGGPGKRLQVRTKSHVIYRAQQKKEQ